MSGVAVLRVDGPDERGVATLTLDRPAVKNALSIQLRDEISDALDRLVADDASKVVVITGAGDAFCSGFDLKEFAVEDPEFRTRLWASSDRYHRTVLQFPLPTVAAVNGVALAGGFDLAVMCDIRVASDRARFAHPEITFGEVVYAPLHDLVGGAVARELCFTGRDVDADEAKRLGLVSSAVPVAGLAAEVERMTDLIVRAPRSVLVSTKAKALRRAGIDAGRTLVL
ncbi:MAG: enoyl-CoA hydratase/isomerase family protein [Acidimicrobiia bacterium]